jgi:hypothetical protein
MEVMIRPYKWLEKVVIYKIVLTERQKIFRSISTLILLFVIPIIVVLLPEDYFDKGKSICLSKLIFNQECYACGISRACLHLINFNFERAFEYNMGSFLILPIFGILWLSWIRDEKKNLKLLILSLKSSFQNT